MYGLCCELKDLADDPLLETEEVKSIKGASDINSYLKMTDYSWQSLFMKLLCHENKTLKFLAQSIVYRRHLQCELFNNMEELIHSRDQQREKAASFGLTPHSVVLYDDIRDLPYKPYEALSTHPFKGINVLMRNGETKEISGANVSPTVNALSLRWGEERLYFPCWDEIDL